MKRFKALCLVFILALVPVLGACDTDPTPPAVEDDIGGTALVYTYEGTPTAAPYTVYNGDDSAFGEYESMFNALYHAGVQGKASNVTYVKDANGLEVFRRTVIGTYHCYDGTNYVGTKAQTAALVWGKERERCYIINGTAGAYVYLGERRMKGSGEPHHFELNAGAYNYMFSDVGKLKSNQWSMGYGYASSYVRLSEATYKPNNDDEEVNKGAWNAYIFINHFGGFNIDLGLLGNVFQKPDGGSEVRWRLVRNCSHDSHKTTPENPGFYSWANEVVTTMTLDTETGIYHGTDDLFFEVIATKDGWLLEITNLTTQKVYSINEKHPGLHEDKGQNFRMLFAASYCPVYQQNIWNARCGAFLKNVIFDTIKIAKYDPSDDYTNAVMEEMYPNEEALGYGFAQGADCADYYYAAHAADGVYKSGAAYKKGDKVLSFSTYYDGTTDVYKNGLGI